MEEKKRDCIENYRFLEFLSEGSAGKVFRARRVDSTRDVAIKIIEISNVNLECLWSENKIHRQLHHPAIVELYNILYDERCVYMVMELCNGGDLYSYLIKKSNRLQEDEVRHLLKPVVEGLIYLHQNMIIHQDISLENLVLAEGMQTKIVDFNLSVKMDGPDKKYYNVPGHISTLSPEKLLEEGHSLPTEIWSLGHCLYQLLVGKPPFESLKDTVDIKYEMPDQLSPAAKDLIRAIFQRNPTDRPKAIEILNYPFFKDELMQASEDQIDAYDIDKAISGNKQHPSSAHHNNQGSIDVGGKSSVKGEYGSSTSVMIQHQLSGIGQDDQRSYIRDQCLTKPEQFNTFDMKPSRYQYADDIVATILEDGQLCVEFLKDMNGIDQVDRFVVFSADGNLIHDVPLPTGKCYPAQAVAPDLSKLLLDIDHKVYCYNNLPEHLWTLYSASTTHVYELRAMMPRVTLISDLAKAELMSNIPDQDFLTQFPDGTSILQKDYLMIINKPDEYKFSLSTTTCLPPDTFNRAKVASVLYTECIRLQARYESLDRNEFPLTMECFLVDKKDKSTSCLPTPNRKKRLVRSASSENLIPCTPVVFRSQNFKTRCLI